MAVEVLTIGHSTLSYDQFLQLLRESEVTAIADVRSMPFSRHFPQFNRDNLREELRLDDIAYVSLGAELGGRPEAKELFKNDVANYELMAKTSNFSNGIRRVLEGSQKFRIALMCSEHDPLDCHRCLLVGRALHELGSHVQHILSTGRKLSHRGVEEKLMDLVGKKGSDLFDSHQKRLVDAYRQRSEKIAFSERQSGTPKNIDAAE